MKKKTLYKKLFKKYELGGEELGQGLNGKADLIGKGAAIMDAGIATQQDIGLNSDLASKSTVLSNQQLNREVVSNIQSGVENKLLTTGNPLLMGIGVGAKIGRGVDTLADKYGTNQYGYSKNTGSKIARTVTGVLNPTEAISTGLTHLKNDDLSTIEKVGAFIPGVSTLVQDKVAKIETGKWAKKKMADSVIEGQNNLQTMQDLGYSIKGDDYATAFANGGYLKPLSNDNVEVIGASHADGGVKLPEVGAEVEGSETINKNFVFSDKLGFAKLHKPIAKTIGKLESKPQDKLTANTLSRLKEKEEDLKVEQETFKAMAGIDNNGKKRNGGFLYRKFGKGGSVYHGPDMSGYQDFLDKQEIEESFAGKGGDGYNYTKGNIFEDAFTGKAGDAYNYTKGSIENPTPTALSSIGEISNNTTDAMVVNPTTNNIGANFSKVVPYVDNITNAIISYKRSKDKIPQQDQVSNLRPVEYNYNDQLAEADNQLRLYKGAVDRTSRGAGEAASNRAAGLFQAIRVKNAVQAAETNANTQEKSRVAGINKNIEANNSEIRFNNDMRKFGAKDDIRRDISENAANYTDKRMTYSKDDVANELVRNQQLIDLASRSPEAREYVKSQLGEEKWAELTRNNKSKRLYKSVR